MTADIALLHREPRAPESREIVLGDGSTVQLRPFHPKDAAALRSFLDQMATRSGDHPGESLPKLSAAGVESFSRDTGETVTLLCELHGHVVAMGHFRRDPNQDDVALSAFVVDPALQGKGMGTALLDRLAEAARDRGIRWLKGEVYATNRRMLNMIAASGFEVISQTGGNMVRVRLNLKPSSTYEQRRHERQDDTAAASVRIFLEPRCIAVVGASADANKIGSIVLRNLITSGYTGRIFPINKTAREFQGLPCFPSVADVGGPIDLAVIAVPQPLVDDVVDDCIKKRVRGILLLTAGYSETGPEGRQREAALLAKLRAAGIRLIGPNCFGVINTDPQIRLNTSFSPIQPSDGRVGLLTQSGALGQAILDYARHLNLGLLHFVSVGNKADISGNDLLQFWKADSRTQVILLYLESFGNPRNFNRLAREITRTKPIICVKAGRSAAGARAASSHTGSLVGSDRAADALFRQCGVIRTTTLEELFDAATLLSHQPLPRGRRVAILTNAGGPAIMAADACEANGLELPTLNEITANRLRELLPPAASVANPVDMLASGSPAQYGACLKALLADSNVDAVLVLFVPLEPGSAEEVAAAVRGAVSSANEKPILATFMSVQGVAPGLSSVPSYRFPESAARALGHAWRYAQWRNRPVGSVQTFSDMDLERGKRIVQRAVQYGGGWLAPHDVDGLLDAAGVPAARASVCANIDEAIRSASRIGYPVALKAIGPQIVHKTEVGGVILNIRDEEHLRSEVNALTQRLGEHLTGLLIQQMVPEGPEILIGATWDETFGHVIAYGAGGTLVDLMRDVSLRIAPLSDQDAIDMMEEARATQLLRGWRGSPLADENAVREFLLRLSALVEQCPQIEEVDFNPTRVQQHGALVLDARVRIGADRAGLLRGST